MGKKKRAAKASPDQVTTFTVSDKELSKVDKILSATSCPTVAPTLAKASIFSNPISCGLPINQAQRTSSSHFGKTLLRSLDTPLRGQNLNPLKHSQGSTASDQSNCNKLKEESALGPDLSTSSVSPTEPNTNQVAEKAKAMTIDLTNGSIFSSQPEVGIQLISSDRKDSSSTRNSFRSGLFDSIESKLKSLLAAGNSASTSTQSSRTTRLNNLDTIHSRNVTRPKQSPHRSHPYRKKQGVPSDFPNSNSFIPKTKYAIPTPSLSLLASFIRPVSPEVVGQSRTKNILTEEVYVVDPPSSRSLPTDKTSRSHSTEEVYVVDPPSSRSLPTDKTSRSHSQPPSGGELKKSKLKDTVSVPVKEVFKSPKRNDSVSKKMVGSHFDGQNQTLLAGKERHLPGSFSCKLKEFHLRHKLRRILGLTSHKLPTGQETNSQTTQVVDLTPELPTRQETNSHTTQVIDLTRQETSSRTTQVIDFTSETLSIEAFLKSTKAASTSSIDLQSRSHTRPKHSTHISQRSHPCGKELKEVTVNQPSIVSHNLNNEQSLVTAPCRDSQPSLAKDIIPHRKQDLKLAFIQPEEEVFQSLLPGSCVQALQSTDVTQPLPRLELINETVVLPLTISGHHLEILKSHPTVVQQFTSIARDVTIELSSNSDNGCPLVVISGMPCAVVLAKEQVGCIAKAIADNTVTKYVSCQYKAIPLLCSSNNLQSLLKYQQEKCLDIRFARKYDCPLRLQDFFTLITHRNQSECEVLQTKYLQDFLHRGSEKQSDFCWESTNDNDVFVPVCSEFDGILKQLYTSHGIEGTPFSYNEVFYTVDFANALLLENLSGQRRRIRKGLPYWHIWSNEDSRFVRHIRSEDIEHFFQFGGKYLDVADSKYIFSFQNSQLCQTDVQTGTELALQRYPSAPSFLPDFEITVSITGLKDDVEFVERSITELSKDTTSKHELQFVIPSNSTIKEDKLSAVIQAQIMNVTKQYFVSIQLSVMGENKIRVVLEGAPEYVQNVYNILSKLTFESQQHLLEDAMAMRSGVPSVWDSQVEKCEIKQVSEVSQEWNNIQDLMKKTLPNVRIQKIERIQNKPLWEKYSIESKHMRERNGGDDVNELHLFHGSIKTDPRDIAMSPKGIDFRYSSRDRKLMWGTGAYFAVNASYSHNYAHSVQCNNGQKEIILALVLTGKSFNSEPNSQLTKPPQLPSSPSGRELYDTVNGETGGSKVYIVYDHDKSYPAYIITYYEKK